MGAGAAIALGAALSPTDPVLAGDLGVDPPAEAEEEKSPAHEFALTTEGGLNDGVALPFVFLGIAVARGDSLVYGAAEALGAIGFVAAFAGGIAFRRHEVEGQYRRDVHDGASVMKHFGELIVILLLGSMLLAGGLGPPGGWGYVLAAGTIFVLRPVTAFVTLVGARRLSLRERVWIAWFGVKGVASLNYAALIATAAFALPDARVAIWTILVTVTLSIVANGITSTPVTRALLGRQR
jgi:NhaP-type Na+/H+ or K+/H+ antiporter